MKKHILSILFIAASICYGAAGSMTVQQVEEHLKPHYPTEVIDREIRPLLTRLKAQEEAFAQEDRAKKDEFERLKKEGKSANILLSHALAQQSAAEMQRDKFSWALKDFETKTRDGKPLLEVMPHNVLNTSNVIFDEWTIEVDRLKKLIGWDEKVKNLDLPK